MAENRNSYIINHSLSVYTAAAILSTIVGQVNSTIDGIIVSNTLGGDAISAVTLSSPIINIALLFGTIFFDGSELLLAPAYGNQQYRQVNRIFTLSMSSVLVVNGLIALVLCLMTDPISLLITDDERLLPLLTDYLPFAIAGSVVTLLAMQLGVYIEISGHPRLVTKAMVILSVANILFDLILVVYFQLGMKGAAIASALSSVVAILSYVPYLTKEPRPFRIKFPSPAESLKLGGNCLQRGMPSAISSISFAVLVFGLNTIVMYVQGANGMFILSVCMQIFFIGMLVINGFGSAITGIGGRLLGEQDWNGMKRLFDIITIKLLVGAGVITLLLFLFPSILPRLFGADDALVAISEQPLRLFSLILVPMSIVLMQTNIYLITNRGALTSVILVALVVCILTPFVVCAYWYPSNIWIAFPIGMWTLLCFTLGIALFMSRREIGIHRIYLISALGNFDSYAVSVNYDFNEVNSKLKDLLFYIDLFEIGKERTAKVRLILEEIMLHQFNMGKKERKQGTFDVSVIDQPERITIIVKDVGKAYNPLLSYQPGLSEDVDEEQFGMILVRGICDKVNYKYTNGLNCLYLNIKK